MRFTYQTSGRLLQIVSDAKFQSFLLQPCMIWWQLSSELNGFITIVLDFWTHNLLSHRHSAIACMSALTIGPAVRYTISGIVYIAPPLGHEIHK